MSWRGLDEIERIEKELQVRIYKILSTIKKFKFHGISFSEVKLGWSIDHREADIVILGPNPNDVFLIIETKRKETSSLIGHVTNRAYIGQALSYAAIAKRRGLNTYFIAVCNPDAIAIYKVPENVEKIVDWRAIEERKYEKVIPLDVYPDFLDPSKNAVFTLKLEFREEFFQRLLDDLVLVWKCIRKPIEVQEFSYKVIEDLRGFVNWLSWNIKPKVKKAYDRLIKDYAEQIKKMGYEPTPEQLAREMAYIFMNKILFYKVLERFWGRLPILEPLYGKTINGVKIDSANKYIRTLNKFFENAIETTKNFEPVFVTGIYDEIVLPDDPEVLRGIDAFIEYIDCISIEKLSDVVGYIYEELIPELERHVLGQFYTPPAVCELITKWCIRSPDDVILGPGSGSGTFEVCGYRRLFELMTGSRYSRYPPREVHEKILSQIYAQDINEFPAHLTAMNLAMRNPRAPSTKMTVFVSDFFTVHPCTKTPVPYRVKIFGPEKILRKYIHIPKVDVVWGNPPYTRWLEIPEPTKEAILRTLKNEIEKYCLRPAPTVGRQPGIYIYWIMHATKFLKENGRLGMIVSNMWLQTDYGINFGKYLLDHYKIKALIDISYRLFEALISTVIILAEKCNNEKERSENEVLFVHVPTELEVEKLGEALLRIGDYLEGKSSTLPSGVLVNKIKQAEIPKHKKWINLFFPKVKDIAEVIEHHPLMVKAREFFWPCEGNSIWSVWAMQKGERPGVSPQDFLFFSPSKIRQRNIPDKYLIPAITRAQWILTFTFTSNDWKKLVDEDKDAYMFICHESRNRLPTQVIEYIRWGEPICPYCGARFTKTQIDDEGYFTCINGHRVPGNIKCITRVRRTRGGGRKGGHIASESYTSKVRKRQGYPPFYDWYDLGGYIPTPIMAIYQAFYHPQFFLCTIPAVTYHAIITFIPKVKIKTSFMEYEPENYKQYLHEIKPNIILDEVELKALLAYMNSTFNWLWLEVTGRRTGGGIIALEPKTVGEEMPILNVKAIDRKYVKELAELFDKLEESAREVIQTISRTKGRRSEEDFSGTKFEMFKKLRPVFKRIDEKIVEILDINVNIDVLWEGAYRMMERRVKGARKVTKPGATDEVSIRRKRASRLRRRTKVMDKSQKEIIDFL